MNAPDEHNEDEASEEEIERALRLGELRYEVEKVAGEPVAESLAPGTPLDVQEQFWKHVLAFESAPQVKLQDLLYQRLGFQAQPVEELEDEEGVHEALWELIAALATIRVFICFTDHLSDRELYRLLEQEVLPGKTVEMEEGSEWNQHFDIAEFPTAGYPEPSDIYLAYYADDETREQWERDFPEMPIPPKVSAPYDRDRFLPSFEKGF